jgi:excinuclease UvrABC nuclease subunit
MKKIIFAVMAVAAIGFTSCGNKTQQAEAVDTVVVEDTLSQATVDQIAEVLEVKDATVLQEVLVNVKNQAANLILDNPEEAKAYIAAVQTYLKENAEKVEAVIGDNEAALTALSAIIDLDPENLVKDVQNELNEGAEKAAE